METNIEIDLEEMFDKETGMDWHTTLPNVYIGWLEKKLTEGLVKNVSIPDISSSGLRYNGGKLRWSLVDFDALEDMVKVLETGADKYTDNNWKKGLKTSEIFESMMRHMTAYMRGEDNDPESGLPHTGHILCNAMFLSYMYRFKPDFDTRYKDKNKWCEGNGIKK